MNESITERPFITLHEKRMYLELANYADNENTCIRMVDEHGQPQGTATINLRPLPSDFVFIKNYSENRGVADAMRRLIEPTGEFENNGAQRIHMYRLGEALCAAAGIEYAVRASVADDDFGPDEPDEDIPDVSFAEAERGAQAHEEGSPADELDELAKGSADDAASLGDAFGESEETPEDAREEPPTPAA
jgi:hypothetical protein